MKKSICIEMLGVHEDFYDRFKLIKEYGFDTAEFWGWENKDIPKLKAKAFENGITICAFSGDGPYSLCDDSQMEKYIEYAEKSMLVSKELGCSGMINVIHSNALGEGGVVIRDYKEFSKTRLFMNMLRTLIKLAPIAEKHGVILTLEALNTKIDHAGNALFLTDESVEIVRIVNSPNVKVLYDIYHMQIMEGDILNTVKNNIDYIGHIHIADVPGRHEPGTGEINYQKVWSQLKECGYKGTVGFELSPKGSFEDAIKAIKNL